MLGLGCLLASVPTGSCLLQWRSLNLNCFIDTQRVIAQNGPAKLFSVHVKFYNEEWARLVSCLQTVASPRFLKSRAAGYLHIGTAYHSSTTRCGWSEGRRVPCVTRNSTCARARHSKIGTLSMAPKSRWYVKCVGGCVIEVSARDHEIILLRYDPPKLGARHAVIVRQAAVASCSRLDNQLRQCNNMPAMRVADVLPQEAI